MATVACATSTAEGCLDRWSQSALGKALRSNPVIEPLLKQKRNYATHEARFQVQAKEWTEDYLIAVALDLEQRVLSRCADAGLRRLLELFQRTYLKRIGIDKPTDVSLLFRGFLSIGADAKAIRSAIADAAASPPKAALDWIKKVYGDAVLVEGVLVVGPKPLPTAAVKAIARKSCAKIKPCPFWDPVFLARVSLLPVPGAAVYVPELASLRVSQDLLHRFDTLSQLVIVHELAHAAQHRALLRDGVDWRETFEGFSDWRKVGGSWVTPVKAIQGSWTDTLARESASSPFSVLPDPPMPAIKNQYREIDGFVFAKTARETQKTGDIGEDVADHIAAYLVTPQRFCYLEQPIAPLKYAWIAAEIFGRKSRLSCEPLR